MPLMTPWLMRMLGKSAMKVLPTNAGIMVDTALGNRAPITEADFSPVEIDAMRKVAMTAMAENQKYAQRARLAAQEYRAMDPQFEAIWQMNTKNPTGKLLKDPSRTVLART